MQKFFLPPNSCISFGIGLLSQRVRSNTEQCECMLIIFFPGIYRHSIILQSVFLGRFQHCMFLQQFQASGYRPYGQHPQPPDKGWVTFLVRTSIDENCRAVLPQGLQMTLTFVRFFIQVQKKLFQGQRILFVQALESSK